MSQGQSQGQLDMLRRLHSFRYALRSSGPIAGAGAGAGVVHDSAPSINMTTHTTTTTTTTTTSEDNSNNATDTDTDTDDDTDDEDYENSSSSSEEEEKEEEEEDSNPPNPLPTPPTTPPPPPPPNPNPQPHPQAPIRCAYTRTCTTTTPGHPQHYRKLISHIFGRNKHSTKQIPVTLWCCYYCRKHYQRARYRERDTWALTQCFWVGQMLLRLRSLPDLVGFRVQLRLRQQQQQHSKTGDKPVVPGWLVERIVSRNNEVWSFEETQELVGRKIRGWLLELRARTVAAGEFPDVEILPVWR
ncbi:hypothetical protein BO82DRAFT_399188 [Aspergillus uvarum CBS 121591]|uniref:Uncharacterized protein n=1 Tax=Aspergillus uvarum CBS 121591 TaxID=1448315 RepID=A0A319CJW9_9EURO|nr:hypothetical protein BO82DRAFT_399188 [Aspergillus uvarum CBS 121591]PYH84770.1 hypothetical protein BO82DRAFT_399188 [Aspergillus uvarum CBS 121591]